MVSSARARTAGVVHCLLALGLSAGCAPAPTVSVPSPFEMPSARSDAERLASCEPGRTCGEVVQVFAADHTSCALMTSGDVVCWGQTDADELTRMPRVVGRAPDAVLIATDRYDGADGARTCYVTDDAELRCSGRGQYCPDTGCGSLARPLAEAPAEIALSAEHTCILLADGSVACRDHMRAGALEPVAGLTDVVDLDATSHGRLFCAVREEGSVTCWSSHDATPTPFEIEGVTGAVEVSLVDRGWGDSETDPALCVRLGNGNVSCGGGSLGSWETVAGVSDAIELGSSPLQTCARSTTGDVACFGEAWGASAVRIEGLDDAVSLAVGTEHACALRRSGDVVCWGANDHGQLGDGTTAGSVAPVPALLPPVGVVIRDA